MSEARREDETAPAPRAVQALILTADVGYGHVAAGRAVADDLRRLGCEAEVEDGLAALGVVARHIIRDGYRLQLRLAPWAFDTLYALFTHVPLVPRAGARLLVALGSRRLRRVIARRAPDVVVSTHPALTAVLGRMRLRHGLNVPLCVTVTDLADYGVWCHRGADVHLVMHPTMLPEVERIAGPGSAVLARPFVADAFLRACDSAAARAALELPADGRIVAVSGGGWGVGDLEGAVGAALAAGATDVVVVAGANARAQEALTREFAGDACVRVWGFTRRMPELLQAADVLIHSTGGMTSLEAASAGCPLVAFGANVGHIRVHNDAMARLGLLRVARSRAELESALAHHLRGAARAPRLGQDGAAPGQIVSTAPLRVRPIAAWRLAAGRAVTLLACGSLAIVSVTSDEAYSLAARPLDLTAAKHVATPGRDVALVVRGDLGAAPALARRLASAGAHASFASGSPASAQVRRALGAAGDDVLPELGGTPPGRWLGTRRLLVGSPSIGPHRVYLASPAGMSIGQVLLARSMKATPLAGRVKLSLPADHSPDAVASGDIVVVTISPSDPHAASELASVAAGLRDRGLVPVSVSGLAATAAGSASDRSSDTAPPMTTASAATVPMPEPRS